MVSGYQRPQVGDFDWLKHDLEAVLRRLRELEAADGMQNYNALVELRNQVENLATEIANVSSSGATWYGPVSTTGSVTASAGMSSTGVYNNLLTTAYRVQYVNSGGPMGYVPSSRQFKEDEQPAPDIREAALALQLLTFRYPPDAPLLPSGHEAGSTPDRQPRTYRQLPRPHPGRSLPHA
ncbi:MAG: hypothetical protein AB7V46_24515, partial [Thermomicrobiales bacterium]